jgi:hypothetical protein
MEFQELKSKANRALKEILSEASISKDYPNCEVYEFKGEISRKKAMDIIQNNQWDRVDLNGKSWSAGILNCGLVYKNGILYLNYYE